MSTHVSDIECSICGLDGGPTPGCDLCGGNSRFVQTRSFTLTEERRGLNTDEKKDRYGPYGEVGPKIVQLPGGYIPGQNNQKKEAPVSEPSPLSEEALAADRIEPVSEEPVPQPRRRVTKPRKPRARKPATPKSE